MENGPIEKLNAALQTLPHDIMSDEFASKRVEVAIVTFPPVTVNQSFCLANEFTPPVLTAAGGTPLGEAVHKALQIVEERKNEYRAGGIEYFRPWIFLITDGSPDPGDDWRGAAAAVRNAEQQQRVSFFAVGVPGADMGVLREFSARPPVRLLDMRFRDMFAWLNNSLKAVAGSNSHTGGNPDEKVAVQELSWGEI